jgi:hypothetical protein
LIHKYLLDKFYYQKSWEYNTSGIQDIFIPELDLKYGYNFKILNSKYFAINTITNAELHYSTDTNYRGLGAKGKAYFTIKEIGFKAPNIEFELEGAYLTNVTQYEDIYYQLGMGLEFNNFSLYTQVRNPISKNLSNPYIVHDDLELNFNYGFLINF